MAMHGSALMMFLNPLGCAMCKDKRIKAFQVKLIPSPHARFEWCNLADVTIIKKRGAPPEGTGMSDWCKTANFFQNEWHTRKKIGQKIVFRMSAYLLHIPFLGSSLILKLRKDGGSLFYLRFKIILSWSKKNNYVL
jgi:hypothetical protein